MTTALPPSVADVERRIQHLILGLSEGRLPADGDVDELRRAVVALAHEGGVPSWRLEEFGSAVRVLARKVAPSGRHAGPAVPPPRSASAPEAAPRRTRPAHARSSARAGHGFWRTNGRPTARRHVPLTRRNGDDVSEPSAEAAERARLADEAMQLRDRAERFAAAISAGRRFPQREAQRVLLHFQDIRGAVDADTRSLNDVAVRRLLEAGTKARHLASGSS